MGNHDIDIRGKVPSSHHPCGGAGRRRLDFSADATSDYTELECTPYKNISIRDHGSYVGNCIWGWTDMDAHGNYTAYGGGEFGPVTAGWMTTVWIPGTARDVEFRGEADTGIVWNRWQENR